MGDYHRTLTDAEVKKALECCRELHNDCSDCPLLYGSDSAEECMTELIRNASNLINYQNAEIENYKRIANTQQNLALDRYFEIMRLKKKARRNKLCHKRKFKQNFGQNTFNILFAKLKAVYRPHRNPIFFAQFFSQFPCLLRFGIHTV